MKKRLNVYGIGEGCKPLWISEKDFRGFRLPKRALTIFLLLMAGAVLIPSSTFAQAPAGNRLTVKAQGNTSRPKTKSAPKAQTQQVTEGATITAKRITLKPGYKFTRVSANTIAIARKNNEGVPIEVTCSCAKGKGGCAVTFEGTNLSCYSNKCLAGCVWGEVKFSR